MSAPTIDTPPPPVAVWSTADRQPHPLAGLRHQLRFLARRDRVRAAVWVIAVVGLVAVSATAVLGLYETPEELQQYAEIAQADAAFKALTGPGYGLDHPTQGAVVMNETSLYTYLAVAFMAIFVLVRHTRAEEDSGRAELVRAAPVGRGAMLVAASLWVAAVSAVIGVGLALTLIGFGLPTTGSIAFGAATFAAGVTFAAIAAACAQLASTSRAANSMAGIVLGLSFLLRAVGDMGTPALTWMSPLGITQAIRPYADERWWVLLVLAAISALGFGAAAWLLARRDLGAGLIGQRPGPSVAARRLATPLALAIRLQRSSVLGWTVGVGVSAFSFGLVVDQAEALADNEAIAEMFARSGQGTITEQFLASLMLMVAILTSGFTVASVLRLRTEEMAGRADPLLATPVSRRRWWWSHTCVALVASLAIVVVGGLSLGAGYALQVGDLGEMLPMLDAALACFAAIALVGALTALAVAAVPRWSLASWSLVAIAAVVGFLAETMNLPQWVRDLSPFEHVPALPAAAFDWLPIAVLGVVALLALVGGALAITRRDMH